jgi:DNA-binding NarL/FixJ family response regulator
MRPIQILLADDHEVVRKGLRALLESQPGWKVIAEATDGREAVEKARDMHPDVAIVDIGMPSLNGLEATRQIVKKAPRTRVLVLTMHDTNPLIQQVVKAGARGYVLKSDVASDLVSAVDALCRDQTFFTSKVSQIILDRYVGKPANPEGAPDPDSPLTPREREVVQLLAEGKSSKEVAAVLGISVKTAETHRINLMRKLDCHSVAEVVRYAVRDCRSLIQARSAPAHDLRNQQLSPIIFSVCRGAKALRPFRLRISCAEAQMAVKILIADDHEIVRQGIRRVLESKPEWEICGEASNGQQAVRMAQELTPDIIIMDVTMPVMSGFEAADEISRLPLGSRVLFFTMHDSASMAGSVRRSQAHGYVVKSRAAQDLIQALERLLKGGTFYDSAAYTQQASGSAG